MSGASSLRDPLGVEKQCQPRLCVKIKVNMLLSKNITNLGIFGTLINNTNI